MRKIYFQSILGLLSKFFSWQLQDHKLEFLFSVSLVPRDYTVPCHKKFSNMAVCFLKARQGDRDRGMREEGRERLQEMQHYYLTYCNMQSYTFCYLSGVLFVRNKSDPTHAQAEEII